MPRPPRRWPGRWFPGRAAGHRLCWPPGCRLCWPSRALLHGRPRRPALVIGPAAAGGGSFGLRAAVDEVAGQDQVGGDAPVRALAELDAQAVPLREPAHDVQAHAPGGGRLEYRRAPQPGVDVGQLVGGNADAGVRDGQDQRPVSGPVGPDDDRCALRRLGRGVVQQLGQDVTDVVRRAAGHLHVGQAGDLGPAVLGDLRDGRAHHVQQRHRLEVLARIVMTRQRQQVLAVAAHPGGEVVDPEEQLQLLRVFLVALQLLHDLEQGVDQGEVAQGQPGQDLVQRVAVPIRVLRPAGSLSLAGRGPPWDRG